MFHDMVDRVFVPRSRVQGLCKGWSACLDSASKRPERVLPEDIDRFRFCFGTNEAHSAEIVFGIPSSSIVTVDSVKEMTE